MWPELRARTGRPRFTRLAPVYFSLKDQSKAGPSEQLSTRCSRDPSSLQTGVHPLGLDPLPLNKGRGLKGAGRVAGGSSWPRPERPTSFLPPFLQAELRHRRPHRHVRCRAHHSPPGQEGGLNLGGLWSLSSASPIITGQQRSFKILSQKVSFSNHSPISSDPTGRAVPSRIVVDPVGQMTGR